MCYSLNILVTSKYFITKNKRILGKYDHSPSSPQNINWGDAVVRKALVSTTSRFPKYLCIMWPLLTKSVSFLHCIVKHLNRNNIQVVLNNFIILKRNIYSVNCVNHCTGIMDLTHPATGCSTHLFWPLTRAVL